VLLKDIVADTILADKGYDAEQRVIEPLQQQAKTAVIPPRRNRKNPREYDKDLYKARHLIENFFAKLKQYRAIATRYDKLAETFLGAIYRVAAVIWLKCARKFRSSAALIGQLRTYRGGQLLAWTTTTCSGCWLNARPLLR
jgi:transposase